MVVLFFFKVGRETEREHSHCQWAEAGSGKIHPALPCGQKSCRLLNRHGAARIHVGRKLDARAGMGTEPRTLGTLTARSDA